MKKVKQSYIKKFFNKNNDFIKSLQGFNQSKDIEKIDFVIKSDQRNEEHISYSKRSDYIVISKFDDDFFYNIYSNVRAYKYDDGKTILYGWEDKGKNPIINQYKGDSGGKYDDKVIFFK